MVDSSSLSLGEAAGRFLASLSPREGEMSQQEVYRFVRWYGWEHPLARLTAPEVANFAEKLALSDIDYINKLELIRAFLAYAKKEGWSKSNLSAHLKAKKVKTQSLPSRVAPQAESLTQQGYAELKTELDALRDKRLQAIDEISMAAADKDFRENAPLDAAKEQHSQIAGRISELEEIIKSATIIEEKQEVTLKAGIGDSVVLRDMASGEELHYTVVSPREVDPSRGKISSASPLGKAIIGQARGEVVEITVPVGKIHYQIEQIGH
ncbi:GreA/GreB family elongation factor [Chloroflexota bacterium]